MRISAKVPSYLNEQGEPNTATCKIDKTNLIKKYQEKSSFLEDKIRKDEIYEEKLCDEIEHYKEIIETLKNTGGDE